jgi:hypothetical protein
MKSRLLSFVVTCIACASAESFALAQGAAIQYVPMHGESYDAARTRLIKIGWEPIPARCDSDHVCWGAGQPELATDLRADTNCGRFRKSGKVLKVCTYVIPDAILVDTVTTAAEH